MKLSLSAGGDWWDFCSTFLSWCYSSQIYHCCGFSKNRPLGVSMSPSHSYWPSYHMINLRPIIVQSGGCSGGNKNKKRAGDDLKKKRCLAKKPIGGGDGGGTTICIGQEILCLPYAGFWALYLLLKHG